MEGFEIFIYICLVTAIAFFIVAMLLKRKKNDQFIGTIFLSFLLISVTIVIISFFIGGWSGMGIGLMGLSIFIGTIIGIVLTSLLQLFKIT
ncbi:YesK family protein [Lysinibacillus sp. KU-BSD001]|uniref:YesK family protein n=1 Tax=Lysinibacillus sp. KU-BSD001 TaxID=3141328 RepID=UPI0036E05119